MTKVDQLIKKFKEFKEELNKNVNMSYAPKPNGPMQKEGVPPMMDSMAMSEKLSMCKNGQWKLDKVDPTENVNIPHPKGKAKMANGVNKMDGTNKRIADPKESPKEDARGKIHMVKDEGTNEKSNPSKPHNKGKFKVMDEVKEKESKKEKVSGLPYNGEDKKMHKSDKVLVGTGTNDENTGPGRNSGHGAL